MTLSRPPLIFLSNDPFLGELHDRFPGGVQELPRHRRVSILWVVLHPPHLLVHADQLNLVLVDHPFIISRKNEVLRFLGFLFSFPESFGGTPTRSARSI